MTVEDMIRILEKEYGISNESDLDKALEEMEQINIAAMVSPVKKRKERKNGKSV